VGRLPRVALTLCEKPLAKFFCPVEASQFPPSSDFCATSWLCENWRNSRQSFFPVCLCGSHIFVSSLDLYQSPSSPVHGLFSSEAQTTSASFRANTCRFANAGGA